jgi:peptidoglycan/LPS O-acetylase OafA/YrhL
VLTATLVIASLAYSVSETTANRSVAYFVTTTRMWEFGIGGLLAWLTTTFVEDKVRFAPFVAQHRWRSLAVALVAIVPAALAASYLLTAAR